MTIETLGNDKDQVSELKSSSTRQRHDALRARQDSVPEIDENGDLVFRFRLDAPVDSGSDTLVEFYRASIVDLLKIVRFYSNGKPIMFDSFAFQHKPNDRHPLFTSSESD